MTVINCGDCRFWEVPGQHNVTLVSIHAPAMAYPDADLDALRDRAREANATFGRCTAITMGPINIADESIPLAVTKDGEEYQADLHTQAEFGCILGQSKTTV